MARLFSGRRPVAALVLFRAALFVLALLAPVVTLSSAWAQGPDSLVSAIEAEKPVQQAPPDYGAWEADADTAQQVLEAGRASIQALESMRQRLVDWRSKFDSAKGINAAQIATLKSQIEALGTAPADGTVEAPETADRRKNLNELLARAQAPGIAANEAYQLADGLIRQTDALVRSRQASALLMLMPSPLNPMHWPSAMAVLTQGVHTLSEEIRTAWGNPARQVQLRNNLPLVLTFLGLAAFLLIRGARLMERLSGWLNRRTDFRGRGFVAAVVSVGEIILPVAGMYFLVEALAYSGMSGPRLTALVGALPDAAFSFFFARWLAGWLFPDDNRSAILQLTDRPAEARLHTLTIGACLALEIFRTAFTTDVRPPLSQAAQAVWLAPLVFLTSIFLYRLGALLARSPTAKADSASEESFLGRRIIAGIGNAMRVVAVVAPLLAAVGYVAAANALIWPAIASAAFAALLVLIQRALTEIYVLVTKSGPEGREALLPVLWGFILVIVALPFFALIWGARVSDLKEVWARFQEGFTFGNTQISPGAVLTFFIVFSILYMVTRLVQGALRSTLLPRTKLDKGAQRAAVSGIGYVGIFVAALVAIRAAGIDLSALAIVVGALSVGIGFGLQNIVQNFVSGIILLIERPISEGDMIEVNGQFGIVKRISVRSTWIETFDRTDVIVPNGDLVAGVVTNLTHGNLTGRMILPVGAAYGSDTRKVQALLKEIIEGQSMVLVDPPPSVIFAGLGPSSLNFEIRAILADVNYKSVVQTEVLHQIIERFAEAGIEIPFAQQDVWFRNGLTLERARAGGAARASEGGDESGADEGAAVTPPAAAKTAPDKAAGARAAPEKPLPESPPAARTVRPEDINYDPREDEREDER